jgi:hypothetical protein
MSNNILRHNGFELDFSEGQMISLTQLWKMMGSPANQDVAQWKRLPETEKLVTQISKEYNMGKSHVLKSKRGKGGETLAHHKLAIEYAGYLSVELRSLFLGWIKDRIEEESNPELAVKRGQDRAIAQWRKQGKSEQWIDTRLKGIDHRHTFTDSLKDHGVTTGYEFAGCTNAIYEPILGGTAKEIKEQRNIPVKTSLREGMSRSELAAVQLAEIIASERMDKANSQGFDECKAVAEKTSKAISQAIS